jgi:hypothetical protein
MADHQPRAKLLFAYCEARAQAHGDHAEGLRRAYDVMSSKHIRGGRESCVAHRRNRGDGAEGSGRDLFKAEIAQAANPAAGTGSVSEELHGEVCQPHYAAAGGIRGDDVDPRGYTPA